MAPRSAAVNLSFTVDSASEDESADELNAFPTPDSNTENKVPARKPRGKAAQMAKSTTTAKAAAKTKTTARRTSGNSVLGAKKQGAAVTKNTGTRGSRKALVERPNENGNETEEVDEFDVEEQSAAPVETKTTRRGRPPAKEKVVEEAEEVEEPVEEPAPKRRGRKPVEKDPAPKKEPKSKATAKPRSTKRAGRAEADETIPETQPEPELEPEPMDIEPSMEMIEEIPESVPVPAPAPASRRAKTISRTAPQASAGARRAGSVSDTERDPALRRKVGDLTKKLEAMSAKYDNLKEAASSGKESNFDQLKRKTEQTAKGRKATLLSKAMLTSL